MKILMLSWEYTPRVVNGISKVFCDLSYKLTEKWKKVNDMVHSDVS